MAADYTLTLAQIQPSGLSLPQPVAVPITSLEVSFNVVKFEGNIPVLSMRPSISGTGGGGGGESIRPTAGMLYPRRQC